MSKLCIVAVVLAGVFLGGCAGIADTYPERARRVEHSWDLQSRMMIDDFDSFLLIDRSSRLSYYNPRVE